METISDYLTAKGQTWQTKETTSIPHSFAGLKFETYSLVKIVANTRQRPANIISKTDELKIKIIEESIFSFYGKTRENYDTMSRKREFAEPRQCLFYHVRKHTILTLVQIGNLLENRGEFNHTSIMHNINTWQSLIDISKPHAKITTKIDEIMVEMFL